MHRPGGVQRPFDAWRGRWGARLHALGMRWLPRRVLRWIVLRRQPRTVSLELTTKCNLACPLCPTHVVGRRTNRLAEEHVDRVLAAKRSLRTACLHVLGEPLLHPDVAGIVARLEERGIRTHFGTNGLDLERHARDLVEAGLSSISIAIDGHEPKSYGRYRVGGDFERVLAGVRALLAAQRDRPDARLHVQLQAIVFPYLEGAVGDVEQFLLGLGADSVVLKEPSLFVDDEAWAAVEGDALRGGRDGARFEGAAARARAFVDGLGEGAAAAPHARTREGRSLMRDRKLCPQLGKAYVLCDGRVVSCGVDALGETAYGNLNDATLPEIWRSEAHAELIRSFQERRLRLCSMCTL